MCSCSSVAVFLGGAGRFKGFLKRRKAEEGGGGCRGEREKEARAGTISIIVCFVVPWQLAGGLASCCHGRVFLTHRKAVI